MNTNYEKLWLVRMGNIRYFTNAYDREDAKRKALRWIGGNSDDYIVEPLTEFHDRIRVEITLST